jgi:penicillin-binding protein 1A
MGRVAKVFKFLLKLCVGGIMLMGLVWAVLFLILTPNLPDTKNLFHNSANPEVIILARDGSALSRTGGNAKIVRVEELPVYLPQAVLATEDRRFYRHFGMDVIGFARALLANIRAGRVVQGGSTITQQLAKNLWLTPERSIIRKLKELMLAIWLEARLEKREILTLYLNRVYLGAGSFGVEAASRRYFGKSARHVTLSEAALLAGLLKAPSRYAPTNDLPRARRRAAAVIDNMVEAGFLKKRHATAAKLAPARLAKSAVSSGGGNGYFVDWIETQIPLFVGRVGAGIIVETTLDPVAQGSAESALARTLKRHGKSRAVSQGAVIAFAPDGAVQAMVGGRSYKASQFNRALQARRQPGSAFKAIVYLAGLEDGLRPNSTFKDAPINIDGWRPKNFDGKYAGTVTIEWALAKSINTVAVKVAKRVGPKKIISIARRLGITTPLSANLTLALGTSEVSLFEMSAAYIPLANGGLGVFPYGIARISTTGGQVLYQRSGNSLGQLIEPKHVGQMNRMLSAAVTDGTGRRARLKGRDVAGKTGTSQDYRDGWFIGYSANMVAGVWVGNDNNKPTKRVTGGQLPATIWRDFVSRSNTGETARALPREDTETEKVSSPSASKSTLLRKIASFFSKGGPAKRSDRESDFHPVDQE